jgi:hypothetical protein
MKTHVLRWTPTTWAALVPFLLVACATYEPFPPADEHDPPAAGLPLGQFCERLPDAHCRWQIDCDAGTQEWCDLVKNDYARPCEAVRASVDAGRIVFDRQGAARCLDKLADGSCLGVAEACRIILGQVPAGESCYPDAHLFNFEVGGDECAAGTCSPRFAKLPATCRGLAGDECSNYPGAPGCGPGTFCDFESATCASLLSAGEPCVLGACGDGLRCVGDPPACAITLAEGAECEDSIQCARSSVCAAGHCLRKSARGQACLADENCPPSDQCVRLDGDRSQPGICFGGMTGDPCTLNSYGASYDCRILYTCVATGAGTATCQSVDGLACQADYFCYPFWCKHTSPSGGVCTRPGNEGEACEDLRNSWEEPPYHACRDDLVCMDGLCRPLFVD